MNPFKFSKNRIWRTYCGGSGIDILSGSANPEDGNFPEDWIASCVEACNPRHAIPGAGISAAIYNGEEISFPELFKTERNELLGPGAANSCSPGFLMKLLDSAERLPVQAHPTRENARTYFNSGHGKTEAWVILSARRIAGEEPYLLLGFNQNLDRGIFCREALSGTFEQSLKMLNKIAIKPGDVFLVPGGMPHAIGPGVTMIEVMEPSDLVIQPERFCGDQELTMRERFGGLAPEKALEIFNFSRYTQDELFRKFRPLPELIKKDSSGKLEILISARQSEFFEIQRLRFSGKWQFQNQEQSCRAGALTSGHAAISGRGYTLMLLPGDSFFMPYSLSECIIEGNAEIIFALPPQVAARNKKTAAMMEMALA